MRRSPSEVRAISSIRSECSAREVKTFWPLMRHAPLPSCSARVEIALVSEPAVGSVTPNACSRTSPEAIRGSQRRFCSSEPCRSSVPMTYICAWQAAALPPERLTSSSTTLAWPMPSPPPPYSSGISAASQPPAVSAATNSCGYASGSRPRQYSTPKPSQSERTASRISSISGSGSKLTRARARPSRGRAARRRRGGRA